MKKYIKANLSALKKTNTALINKTITFIKLILFKFNKKESSSQIEFNCL
jgi:hypothetical protein